MIYKKHTAFICLIIAAPLLQGRVETNAPLLDSSNSSVVTLPAVTVVAQQESPDGPSAADPSGYSPLEAKGATRTLAPIMETPISEQVISQQVLKDQQTIYLNDALHPGH